MVKTLKIAIGCFAAIFSSFYLYNALVLLFEYQSISLGIISLICALCIGQLFFLIFYNLFIEEKRTFENTKKFWQMTYKKAFGLDLSISIACLGGTVYLGRYLPSFYQIFSVVLFVLLILITLCKILKRNKSKSQADFGLVTNKLQVTRFESSRKKSIQLSQTYIQNCYKNMLLFSANTSVLLLIAFMGIILWKYLLGIVFLVIVLEIVNIAFFIKCVLKEFMRIREELWNGNFGEIILFVKEIYSLPYDLTIIAAGFEEYLVYALYHVAEYEQCIQIFDRAVLKKTIKAYSIPYHILSLLELKRYEDAKNVYEQFKILKKSARNKKNKTSLNKFDNCFANYFAGEYQVASEIATTFKSQKPAQKLTIQKLQSLVATAQKQADQKDTGTLAKPSKGNEEIV